MIVEELRLKYKPEIVRTLFIGESAPAGGKFFYLENSDLYKSTKIAFDRKFNMNFNPETFKHMGYWLYDICDSPVNHIKDKKARIAARLNGVDRLIETIEDLKPERIIVVMIALKSTFNRQIEAIGYHEGQNAYYLPFPSRPEHKRRYETELEALL